MKIIGIRGNYGESGQCGMPEVYLMSDSSLLKDGKPFFVPEFADKFVFYPTIVVHICRLGKNIARKFAPRYYDQLTVGLAVEAVGMKGEFAASAGALSYVFDGSAILGDFIDVNQLPAIDAVDYEVKVDGAVAFTGTTAQLRKNIDELVEYVSRYMTLKIGDYIYVSQPGAGVTMTIDSHIEATLDGKEVIKMKVK